MSTFKEAVVSTRKRRRVGLMLVSSCCIASVAHAWHHQYEIRRPWGALRGGEVGKETPKPPAIVAVQSTSTDEEVDEEIERLLRMAENEQDDDIMAYFDALQEEEEKEEEEEKVEEQVANDADTETATEEETVTVNTALEESFVVTSKASVEAEEECAEVGLDAPAQPSDEMGEDEMKPVETGVAETNPSSAVESVSEQANVSVTGDHQETESGVGGVAEKVDLGDEEKKEYTDDSNATTDELTQDNDQKEDEIKAEISFVKVEAEETDAAAENQVPRGGRKVSQAEDEADSESNELSTSKVTPLSLSSAEIPKQEEQDSVEGTATAVAVEEEDETKYVSPASVEVPSSTVSASDTENASSSILVPEEKATDKGKKTTTSDGNVGTIEEKEDEESATQDQSDVTVDYDSAISPDNMEVALNMARALRGAGKKLHDEGDYKGAAEKFGSAAEALLPVALSASIDDDEEEEDENESNVVDDFATCRLHQALCLLKAEDYTAAATACSDVLEGPLATDDAAMPIESTLRARAFHRRAKAHVALGDTASALSDARDAAFLGDSRAVALYGKLMRENSSLGSGETQDISPLGDMSLLQSLMSKSDDATSNSDVPDLGNMMSSPLLSILGNSLDGQKGSNGAGSLAKSVVSSLSKRLEDESTQTQICNFLQGTSGPQLQQMATMAGVQLGESHATRIAKFCQGVTPKTIRRTMRTAKVGIYFVRLLRKFAELVGKYKSLIVIFVVLQWTKSAMFQPLPVNRKALRLAARAAKREAKKKIATTAVDAMKSL